MFDDCRSHPRRRVYLGEGLTFDIGARAEAVDLTCEGLGLAIVQPLAALPAMGDAVTVRYTGPGASGETQEAVVRHVGSVRGLPRVGLSLVHDAPDEPRFACTDAFAAAPCPWFADETLRFRIVAVGAGGMTVRTSQPLPPKVELDFELQLAHAGVERARGRLAAVRGEEVDVAWIEAPHKALSRHLLAVDQTLTPAALRAGGLGVGSVADAVGFDYASSSADYEEILALRLLAHQAEGHLDGQTIAGLRSSFDSHSRHLICRFGGRIVGYVRVIFVDRDPARSQYVSWGGHEVPDWLWAAGFVEAGAGAMHPDFQRAGLFGPLMQRSFRVAVQSGHRYVLGACEDDLLAMYQSMGFEVLESRIVEPKPGWRFRSHLIYVDAERATTARTPARRPAAFAASA